MKNALLLRLGLAIGTILLSVGASSAPTVPKDKYRGGNFVLEAGWLTGAEQFGLNGGSLTLLGGYTINRHLFVGGGVSLSIMGINHATIIPEAPFFARIKYSLLKSKITPYISLDAGYDPLYMSISYEMDPGYVPAEGDAWVYGKSGGVYLRPEAGVLVRLKKLKAVHFGIGYCRLRGEFSRYEHMQDGLRPKQRNALEELTFRAGFTF